MGRGRKPKPTHLKLLAGNPGHRPINEREPKPDATLPRCPAWLDDEAKKEWKRMAKRIFDAGLLTALDVPLLELYCTAYSKWIRAQRMVDKVGEVLKSKEGNFYQNPYLAVANKAMDQMHKYLCEFGMSPSARSKVIASHSGKQPDKKSKGRFFA